MSPPAKTARAPKPDPHLERPPKRKLLAIDWRTIKLTTDADALALWTQLALTPDDWHEKLEEVPHEYDRLLAIALLRQGNFTCVPARPTRDCSLPVFEVPEPAPTATLVDPCFRRLVALWAIEHLEKDDVPLVMDGLRGIAALPPPESQLIVAALKVIPDDQPAKRLELLATAFKAGQHDIVNHNLHLDETHLVEAATKHHIDGALDILPASLHRATFLAAIVDDQLATKTRVQAIAELASLDDKLAKDLQKVLVKATSVADCTVAAAAARTLVTKGGEPRYKPTRPRTTAPATMMRSLCVLASYEKMAPNDEPSLLPGYVPPKGLERVVVSYDPLSETDQDGDGDPHTEHATDLIAKTELVVPQVDDMIKAMQKCKATTCTSTDFEFKFGLRAYNGELLFHRLDIVERPPCPRTP